MRGLKSIIDAVWHGTGHQRGGLSDADAELAAALGVMTSAAGVSVSPDTAMRLSAVNACVRLIAESIASLPLHVYRRSADGRRARADDSSAARLLHDEPNELMSSFTFRETLSAQLLLWGNAYAAIVRRRSSEPVELLPVQSRSVRVRRAAGGGLVYDVTMLDERTATIGQADMLHIPGLSYDGLTGLSPVRYAAQSIGLAIAAEQFGATFFGNGSRPSGVITMPGVLSSEQAKQLRAAWYDAYGGLPNSNKTAVLFNGAKFEPVSMPPEEAQFIETRKFQVADIARWFRVPPHMIGDLDKATFSNIEHQALEFVTHTLRPWLVRIEQELNRKLFPSSTDGRPNDLYCEFAVDGLLRGDVKSRADYYVKGRQWGWLSANDIRRLENMEPIDGGDEYLTPLNMTTVGSDAGTEPAGNDPSEAIT